MLLTIAAAFTTLVPDICKIVVSVVNSFALMLIIIQKALPLSKQTRLLRSEQAICWKLLLCSAVVHSSSSHSISLLIGTTPGVHRLETCNCCAHR